MADQPIRVFWDVEGGTHSVTLSMEVGCLLDAYARNLKTRTVDVLREILGLFGHITESDIVSFLKTQSLKPS